MHPPRRRTRLGDLELTLWGEASDRLLVTVHGKYSHQHDADISLAVRRALEHGEQALTWDLPGHGDRPGGPAECRLSDAAAELSRIWTWATRTYAHLRVFATSMGAYLTLITAPQDRLSGASFLSPVVDMAGLIDGLLRSCAITPEELREQGVVATASERLEWSQYEFVTRRPVPPWSVPTRILTGALDDLVPRDSVRSFCRSSRAELSTVPKAGHHFRTSDDLAALAAWLG